MRLRTRLHGVEVAHVESNRPAADWLLSETALLAKPHHGLSTDAEIVGSFFRGESGAFGLWGNERGEGQNGGSGGVVDSGLEPLEPFEEFSFHRTLRTHRSSTVCQAPQAQGPESMSQGSLQAL